MNDNPSAAADLAQACEDAGRWPHPGSGATLERWRRLSALAERDLVLARLVEAHADAVAILGELEGAEPEAGRTYGVWAAGGPSLELVEATLKGTKDWCSGATLLTHALVTTSDNVLVEVDLHQPGVSVEPLRWADQGMRGADTRSVQFDGAAVRVVAGDYLRRPGFWAGGVGVAACWYGGIVPLLDPLRAHVRKHEDDAHAAAHLGACMTALDGARAVLRSAAAAVDGGGISMSQALRARGCVADTAADVVARLGRALGPGPLARNALHAQRVADITLYVRQDHAEKDRAALAAGGLDESWSL